MKLKVVPPLYFDVIESYNTRMRPEYKYGKPNKERAFCQWASMVSILKHGMGVDIQFEDPQPGLHDMAFACDPGLWVNDLYIAGNFWAKPREPEVDHSWTWFNDKAVSLTQDSFFEGGDCVMVGNTLLIGYGKERTNYHGVREVAAILKREGVKVVPIRRITDEFYHLNSVLTYYPSAKLLAYYPKAFEANARRVLEENLPDVTIVALGDEAVMREHDDFGGEYLYSYCLNSIEHDGRVLMPYCSSQHREVLERHGLRVIVPKDGSSEFERSGGSYRCLTMIHNITRP